MSAIYKNSVIYGGSSEEKEEVTPHVDFENYEELGVLRFGVDGDGNYGYYKADDSFVPFKSGGNIGFKTIGNLDETSSVSFEVPKDKFYLCILKYSYTPDYHYIEIIPTVGNYGARFITSNDYKTIQYNIGGYSFAQMNTTREELDNSIKFTLNKLSGYTFGNVELMYFPIDGSPITPSEESSMYDVISMFEFISQGSVYVIFGEDKIRTRWNGSASSIGAIAYSATRIDLSKYNSISIKFRATEHISDELFVHLLLSNTKDMIDPRSGAYREVRSNVLNEEVTLTLDVSDITGEYYVGLAPTGTTCEMYDLKFE